MHSLDTYFSIADLENFSCIKAHTFRTWEQRFSNFKAKRKEGNFRYYTLADLQRLLHISVLNKAGLKISKLAKMSDTEIEAHLQSLAGDEHTQGYTIARLIVAMFSLDIEALEKALDNSIEAWGVDRTIEEVIIPFLERVGIFSYKNRNTSEVHFAVTALRKKLILGIENMKPKKSIDKKALLFLPQGEHFDLILLYLNYLLKEMGLNVLYLGTNVSVESLKTVVFSKMPDYLIAYVPSKTKFNLEVISNFLQSHAPYSKLIITGHEDNDANGFEQPENLHYLQLTSFLEKETTAQTTVHEALQTITL